ncbi:VWA domain-containing protein [Rariglobus hedericola]|uniref:VWA domain-containing protein n=1 Tax=Rariglobus hedericola TaxID=2597822 RepID=A0A556QQ39_9BACT|nr:VWA domain-containing protein [Rariglobus hedericola]TSJ78766.1 VWA domain-containing protein [Rariglobus hedericola]
MTFYWPHAFWLLMLPLALLLRDLLRQRTLGANTHPKITQAEAKHSSLVIRSASSQRSSPRVRIFLYIGLVAATFAVARPQWGRLEEPVFDQAREIIIALDLSRSMLAQDVKPTRLERARLLITSLLERLKGERVGLIVFSGTAFLQSPLSSDYEILREFLPVLDSGYLPEGGTDYDALLETTITAFSSSNAADRFLIVLSDGEAQTDTWRKHLDDLKTKGIRVLGLGIGTSDGAMIPDGAGAFMKDERGAVVLSKLNPSTLRELADKTNGVYSDASSWVDLSQLIQTTVEQGKQGEFKETNRVRLAERFQWPLAAALACFLFSFWREFPVRPKPRAIQLAAKAAALALITSLISPPSADAAEPSTAAEPVTQIIGRLATREQADAKDYAELARATVTYGSRAQASQEKIPEGVVRDALAAVSKGAALDPKAADWPALREELETLLPKKDPPPPKQDKPKPDEKKPEQNKDGKSDQKDSAKGESSDQSKSDKKSEDSKSNSPQPDDQKSGGGDKSGGSQAPQDDAQKKPGTQGQSAFGDMKKDDPAQPKPAKSESQAGQPEPAPTDPSEMQQVGGTPTGQSSDPARQDASLTIPLQKLDQVKQGDSPAHLFQLLQGPSTAPSAPKGKDW